MKKMGKGKKANVKGKTEHGKKKGEESGIKGGSPARLGVKGSGGMNAYKKFDY